MHFADNQAELTPAQSDKRRKLQTRRPWSQDEKNAVLAHLEGYILRKQIPGKRQIDACIKAEPALNGRSWRNIKDFCRNSMKHKRQ